MSSRKALGEELVQLQFSPVWPEPKKEESPRLLPVGWRGTFGPFSSSRGRKEWHWVETMINQQRNGSSVGILPPQSMLTREDVQSLEGY